MDGHGEYSPLERSRLLRSGLDGVSCGGSGSSGARSTSVSEFAGRAATPTTLTLAHYHNRFGLSTALPGSNLAVMSSFLTGAHSSEARKAMLIDFQQYWSAHADNFPRYLMTGGLYPSYPTLLPGAAESLSLLGGPSTGAGPSQSQHVAHYQRLLEMQKEAYMASMAAAAANHHTALYGITTAALPPFIDHTPYSSHGPPPFSLVKQEPRELSCTEKTAKQSERRAMGFKVDLDLNRGSKDSSSSSSSLSLTNTHSTQLKEPKLSPSMSSLASAKSDKGSNVGTFPGKCNVHHNVKKSSTQSFTNSALSPTHSCTNSTSSSTSSSSNSNSASTHSSPNSSLAVRNNSNSFRSKSISPSNRLQTQASVLPSTKSSINSSASKKCGSKSSLIISKHPKNSATGNATSVSTSSLTVAVAESPIVSMPMQAAAPIPLATVQHDGVFLSALASPSSAAASLASTKPVVLKQQTDKLVRASVEEKDVLDIGKSVSEANTSSGLLDFHTDAGVCNEQLNEDINTGHTISHGITNHLDNPKVHSDDSSDIVVDSTENDDFPSVDTSSGLSKSDQDRAIEETIEKVATATDTFAENNTENVRSPKCAKVVSDGSNTTTLLSVGRMEISSAVTSSGSTSGIRTVCAKTQSVPTVTVSGCVQMTSSITTQASTSALPYYHTLYSKPQGVRRVHATTFVPEVGIFKGPSIKAMTKSSSSPSSSGTSALSPDNRHRLDPKSVTNNYSFSADGHSRPRDSTPSPSLMSPRDFVCHSAYSFSSSPGIAHTTTEISSSLDTASLDSASVRSQSVASFHSVPDVGDSDDESDNESGLVIDKETYDENQISDSQNHRGSLTCSKNDFPQVSDADKDDLTLKNNDTGDEEDTVAVSTVGSDEDTLPKKGLKSSKVIVCDPPFPGTSSDTSFTVLESSVSLVPSELSDKTCCEVAIDYSLPKTSCTRDKTPISNSSCDVKVRMSKVSTTPKLGGSLNSSHQPNLTNQTLADFKEQNSQMKNANLSKLCSRSSVNNLSMAAAKLITSTAKPIEPFIGKSLPTAHSPYKRMKPNSDYQKLQVVTPAVQDSLCKVSRRLRLQEDGNIKRCGSAPPTTSTCYLKTLRYNALQTSDVLNERGLDPLERLDNLNDHCLGNNIPVGIAVAQIRPHHIHQPKETQTTETRDGRHVHTSVSSKNMTQTTTSMTAPATALATSLVVAGPTVNSSPWLQQMPFPIHQAVNSAGATFDPITAPSGFKFVQDSLTGRVYIVPAGDFVEQGGVWPTASFASPAVTGSTHYQANVSLPTITISGPEGRDGLSKREINNAKSFSPENTTENIIPEKDMISKDKAGLTKGGENDHMIAQPNLCRSNTDSPSLGLITTNTTATVVVNPVSNKTAVSSTPMLKVDRPTVESRGCSPIVFEDVSSSLSILSTLSSLTSRKVSTCTIGIQTYDDLIKPSDKKKIPLSKISSNNQAVQTSPSDLPILNPLSVQCPDLDSFDSLEQALEIKSNAERPSYNPFTDPQILQAADGLELLSTLAEKRTKSSNLDDPKRIFPSPSDSFKSDSASVAAIDDTLSPVDAELKSEQCTPRREIRRDLSPKWSLPKKEYQTVSVFADFKAPSDIDVPDDSDVRVKLAEVQRQYKEKQKELAKLQSKKSEESKPSKRGPGRPPKKKIHTKKSDDESSSSSPKLKEHHQPQKRKRPAEELVDMVFRKLPPVIKPGKVSRSIHYVKSKTGPFFRRKSASSSVKRNKDLFGFDESNWPSFSERKHQEKIKGTGSFSGKIKSRHISSSSQSEDSKHSHDAGNIFDNLESFGGDYVKRRDRALKHHSGKHKKSLSGSRIVSLKSESCSISSHQESGLGLLAKFALTVSSTSLSSPSVSLSLSSLTTTTSSSTSTSGNQSAISSFSNNTFSTNISISSSAIYCSSLYNSCSSMYNMSNTGNGSQAPSITFGSLSSLMSSPSSGMMSFSSPGLAAANSNCSTPTTTAAPGFSPAGRQSTPVTSMVISPASTSLSVRIGSPLFPSPGAHNSSTGESSSGTVNSTTSSSNGSTTSSSTANSSTGSGKDISPSKRRHEEDSDTDTSDTSPSKKRKPGRPRKINPEKSLGGTETIWAKKSSSLGLLQVAESNSGQAKDGPGRKLDPVAMTPLFLDEEWTRRRSERIFLNEPSPLPSPALSPSPRGEPVWKLSNFMPKSKKVQDVKFNKESDKEKNKTDSLKDQPPSLGLNLAKSLTLSSPTVSSSVCVKIEGKELLPLMSGVKTAEISVPKMEDAKLIVKLEDSTNSSSLSTSSLSSPRMDRSNNQEKVKHKKKKIISKTKLSAISLSTSSASSSSTPPPLENKKKRAEEHSKIKLQKAKSLHDLTQRVKKKYSKKNIKMQKDNQPKKDSRIRRKKRWISTDSSDNDNFSLDSHKEDTPTPEPRSCKLQQQDLIEGLKVLYLIDGLFHEGTVKALQPPDVYGVLTAGQRGNRPHILCLEEILKWAVMDVKPGSVRYLPEGTRVCAFWSQQFSCLYPGTVAKSSPIYNGKKLVIPVDFDDGDNGRIELDHIRLLPADFTIVEYEADPLEVTPKRKQSSLAEASEERKSLLDEPGTSKPSKTDGGSGNGVSKTNNGTDEASSSGTTAILAPWRWEGKGTKRPGGKGRAKKIFYKAVTRGKETIRVGDSAVFVSRIKVNCPYIGHIESLWEGWNGQMMVKVHWYYHPEETESDRKLADPRNALFESHHKDENDMQTIAYKCDVLPYAQYQELLSDATKKGKTLKNVYYLAGYYDPSAKNITFYHGVL